MKKKFKRILMWALIAVIIAGATMMSNNKKKEATFAKASAYFGTDTVINIPPESGEKGTENNPFVILEIVPYEGYAEIGYMISGCEPIPMDQLQFDETSAGTVCATNAMTYTSEYEIKFELTAEDTKNDSLRSGEFKWSYINWEKKPQYGYYERVASGSGDYVQNVSGSNYTYSQVGTGKGNFIWVPNPDSQNIPTNHQANKIGDRVHTYQMKYYYKRKILKFVHKNQFLKEVLRVPEEDIKSFKIQVITVTPKELNESDKQKVIDRADLIYFSPRDHFNKDLTTIWEKYHPEKKVSNPPTDFLKNDLTWESTVRILKKASDKGNMAPIIFDIRIFTEELNKNFQVTVKKKFSNGSAVPSNITSAGGYSNNIAKLYQIMQQSEPKLFYDKYITTGLVKSVKCKDSSGQLIKNGNVVMTTGYYTEQASTSVNDSTYFIAGSKDPAGVWCIHTFLPYELFSDYNDLNNNRDKVFESVGIDNYRVIVDGGASNVSVRHNFYSYNGDNSITQHLVNDNFTENKYRKDAFDFFETLEGKRYGSISPAMAVFFLLHQVSIAYERDTLSVLEIEPCNDFIWDGTEDAWSFNTSDGNGSSASRLFFNNLIPNFGGKIKVATMTTSEFIGRAEDLSSSYDFLYFGLRDGAMKKGNAQVNGTMMSNIPVYNNTSLNGKVYLHNGDTIKTLTNLKGLGSTGDYYRFSGNDITKVKLDALISYMDAGNPVILDSGFYKGAGIVNDIKIDLTSNMCKLAKYKSSYLFNLSDLSVNDLETILSKSKCKIKFGKVNNSSIKEADCYPKVYRDKTVDKYKTYTDDMIYINAPDTLNRSLRYDFYIEDPSANNDTYQVKLYIDLNGDGKFDSSTENINNLLVMKSDGNYIAYNALKAGTNYTVTTLLGEDNTGVLPWKLTITSLSNSSENDSVINYCAIKASEQAPLNILQIKSDNGNTVDLSENELFKKYSANLNEYKINVSTMTASEFEAVCGNSNYRYILKDDDDNGGRVNDKSKVKQFIDDDGDGLYEVDILVLGFADRYSDISNVNALKNLEDYIGEGKTVIFTHDTTSFINTDTGDWGYHLNQEFRNLLGMDRFGVMLTESERISSNKDFYSDNYIQGYSNMNLNRFAVPMNTINQYASHMNFVLSQDVFRPNINCNYVTNTNRGQITSYPYQIDENFAVDTTHGQFYQLDLENKDIVVWYCLSDDNSRLINPSTGTDKGIYSSTPNDVRNNYYIYSKGNITYSGIGHLGLTKDMEVKLFINTIIAAYSATVKAPKIIITNENKSSDSMNRDYIYVNYDIYDTSKAYGEDVLESAGNKQKIKFKLNDNNALLNKEITIKYYEINSVTKPDGSVVNLELELSEIATKKVSDNSEVVELHNGEEYYFECPLTELDGTNQGKTILIKVFLRYGKNKEKCIVSEKQFTLMRRGLFDLD